MKQNAVFSRRKFIRAAGVGAALPTVWTQPRASDQEQLQTLLTRKESNIWLFTGDSITHGAKHTHGFRSYPEVFAERIRWELKRVRDIVINTGISGNAIPNILSDFDWRVSQFKPAVVSLMIGTNDCARAGMTPDLFAQNLTTIVGKIRDLGAVPILHTPNPIILEKAPERRTLPEYIPVIRNVAEQKQVVLVDHFSHWQNTTDIDVNREWLNDPLHPGPRGHQEIARLLFKTLSIFDPQEATCGGPYYEGEH
ncbi:lysophospholipase L1-like esterase [Larkinella arboricola]|uniref:Lysophospholipase L1-like esterase n=1 Tax=Larkinella arboricola TaxID=643671 RepID=A0A327WM72_LARAB|nr:SGNH/GDSL hydrolase family protein [Larkinella arboricola]RAJ93113.1 lysophospholipase L1-like esterase [Larkinella arboricola]